MVSRMVLAFTLAMWNEWLSPSRSTSVKTVCFFGSFLAKARFFFADQRFISLDNLVIAADRCRAGRLHAFANAMAHEPRGFVGQPKHAGELQRAHALLARG